MSEFNFVKMTKAKKTKSITQINSSWYLKYLSLALLTVILVILASYLIFLTLYQGKVYPGVKVGTFNVGGAQITTSHQLLNSQFQTRADTPLKIKGADGQDYTVELLSSLPQLNLNNSLQQAYRVGREDDYWFRFKQQVKGLLLGIDLPLELTFGDKQKLLTQLETINNQVQKDPTDAQLNFAETITITPSVDGEGLDIDQLLTEIENYLTFKTSILPQTLPLKKIPPHFSTAKAYSAKLALESVKAEPITLNYGSKTWTVDQPTLYSLLDLNTPISSDSASTEIIVDQTKLASYLKTISSKIYQPLQNPRFTIDPNSNPQQPRVKEFQAAQDGKELDLETTTELINQSLAGSSPKSIDLPVKVTKPQLATESTNNFGIEGKLGTGISYFAGSIENRIFNLTLAASRINGVLVAPGETFSFNQTIGDVTAATGYKQAYVIKSGRTVLDDGGGVCQVSTTLFRAVLNAGLPVISRTAHAYRVSYYEQSFLPGLDATTFYPTVDFKFKNDTNSYLLIQAHRSGTTLAVDLYGKSDGRIATLTKPVITDQTPPPPELRQDDPTLPRGTVKQVDFAAWGAKVSFKRTVQRDGQVIISETFNSNFKPWQAIFLVGTKDNQ